LNPSASIKAKDVLLFQKYVAIVMRDLASVWAPHSGQMAVGVAHFIKGMKKIFVRCGRKFGKTELACYILWRLALTKPNQHLYYIAPTYKQAKELVWENGRLPGFMGKLSSKYIEKISESEHRITFKNGSFVKIDGSENYEAYRGINPHGIVYDEYKDFHPKFHEGMEPNLATFQAPLFIFGTPPDTEDHPFCRTETGVQRSSSGAAFKMPTNTNPYISQDWLDEMQATLEARGEWHVWMREYMAEIVPSGALHIFPMFKAPRISPDGKFDGHTDHVRPHAELMEEIVRYPKDYNYHAVYDPASTSCFGALFCAVHKQNKRVTVLKEIYEKNKDRTSSKQIWPRAWKIKDEIMKRRDWWRDVYDYAAAWFANEIKDEYGESMIPCVKDLKDKEVKLSSIKDFIREGLFVVSDQCPNLVWEMRNYATDEEGKIPKKNDHLIDCLRYLFNDAHLHTIPKTRYVRSDDMRVLPEEGFPDFEEDDLFDIYDDITEEFYD
jgi:hypothetical protein